MKQHLSTGRLGLERGLTDCLHGAAAGQSDAMQMTVLSYRLAAADSCAAWQGNTGRSAWRQPLTLGRHARQGACCAM